MPRPSNALRVELVYDRDCPNADLARAMIRAALEAVGGDVVWGEWEREDVATPVGLRGCGSPSVFVNGRDVACDANQLSRSDANSCRVYVDEHGGVSGAPSADLIASVIRGAESP